MDNRRVVDDTMNSLIVVHGWLAIYQLVFMGVETYLKGSPLFLSRLTVLTLSFGNDSAIFGCCQEIQIQICDTGDLTLYIISFLDSGSVILHQP